MTGRKNRWEEEHFRFQAIFESSVDAILAVDPQRHIVLASPSVQRIFGYDPSELIGQSIAVLYHRHEDFVEQGRLRYSMEASESLAPYEVEYRRKDGTTFPGEASGRKILSSRGNGKIAGFMVMIRDISRRKQLMVALAREREQWFVTLKSLGDAVVVTDGQGLVTFMNPVAETLTGYSLLEASGRPVDEVFRIEDETTGARVDDPVRRCLAGERLSGLSNHIALLSRNGQKIAIEETASPVLDTEHRITGIVLVFRDVTEKREMERRLAYQAQFDHLTRIPNRVLFHDRLDQALERARRQGAPLALLYMDLDSFKEVNDSLGHQAGDLVLREAATRLVRVTRGEDTVARMGGDEFTVIMTGFDSQEGILSAVDRIFGELSQPIRIGGRDLVVSASIGVSVYPRDGLEASELLRNADIAMYKAKERRSNAVEFFSGEMSAALDRRVSMTNALRQALVRSEIFLEFQPVVDLVSNKPVGFETLVRWRHPEKGLLLPGEFIDHAESTGLIGSLGSWVLREACREAVRWNGSGIFFSVNISGRQLQDASFPDSLRVVLEETGLPPQRLELEFSETIFFQKDVGRILSELREIGVRLVIDDFGKGFSSLGSLRKFPVDRVKIDRDFVAEIGRDPRATAIVRTMLSLAKDLGLSAIGEGAESVDQVAFLRENGCSLAQGFLFSRPLAAGFLPPFFEKDFFFSGLKPS